MSLITQATNEEILNDVLVRGNMHGDKFAGRLSFESWTVEAYDRRTEHQVRHKSRSSSQVRNVDGVPMVKFQGKLTRLYGKKYTLRDGFTMILFTIKEPKYWSRMHYKGEEEAA